MVRPSNPKLMARILEAVTHLGEGKGSLTRDVLDFVKQHSFGQKRNLTMQVRRALKHAVNAGLLRCKSGRYKMQLALNPISHHQHHRHEDKEHKHAETLSDVKNEPPVDGTDPSRRVQDRRKPSRKKRAAKKGRKRSLTRSTRRKLTKRRAGTMEKKGRKASKRGRRKADEIEEDWPTRRRRMMSKSKFDDEADDDDEDEEEEEEDEEDEGEEEEDDLYVRDRRNSGKMKSVNEDSTSNVSGDSVSVGKHRSRRSKHLASDRKSPSKRGNGDSDGHRKSTRRSSSRRRSQPRQRDNRRDSGVEEVDDDNRQAMDDEPDNEPMEHDDDQRNVERNDDPPENQGIE